MSAEANKNLVRRFFEEAWGKGNVAAVNVYMATGYMELAREVHGPGHLPHHDDRLPLHAR